MHQRSILGLHSSRELTLQLYGAHLVFFFLKKPDATQVKYTAFDGELLACVADFRHFRHRLEGRKFRIFTCVLLFIYLYESSHNYWNITPCEVLYLLGVFLNSVDLLFWAINLRQLRQGWTKL
jgi:hypothetical protein